MAINQESFWDSGNQETSPEVREWLESLPTEQEMMARAMRKLSHCYRHDDEPALCAVARAMAEAEVRAIRLEIELDEEYQLEQLMKPIKARFPLGDPSDLPDPHMWN